MVVVFENRVECFHLPVAVYRAVFATQPDVVEPHQLVDSVRRLTDTNCVTSNTTTWTLR